MRAEVEQRDEAVKIRGGDPARLPDVVLSFAVCLPPDLGVEPVGEAAVGGVVEADGGAGVLIAVGPDRIKQAIEQSRPRTVRFVMNIQSAT